MKLLLDTHTFIWWDSDPPRLSPHVFEICRDSENLLLLSVVSVWEIQIKLLLGRLTLGLPLPELIDAQRRINRIEVLPVNLEHARALDRLPALHKDPFDRMLIAQAQVEGATVLSKDPIFSEYPVQVVW
jgi:PIN domain nuclease of toxin-antitoxin system